MDGMYPELETEHYKYLEIRIPERSNDYLFHAHRSSICPYLELLRK